MTEMTGVQSEPGRLGLKLSWSDAALRLLPFLSLAARPPLRYTAGYGVTGLDDALPLAHDAANNPSDGADQRAAMNQRDGPRR